MKIEKKYFWVLMFVFSVVLVIMSYTTYYLVNRTLLGKYKELYENQTQHLLSLCEAELDQLTSALHYMDLAHNFNSIEKELSEYEYIQMIREMDNVMATLSAFDVIRNIQNLVREDAYGRTYWYGGGNNYSENDTIKSRIAEIDAMETDLQYLSIDNSAFYLSRQNQVVQFGKKSYTNLGLPNGYLFFELNPYYFQTIFESFDVIDHSEIYLLDENNYILFTNSKEAVGTILDAEILQSIAQEEINQEESISKFGWKILVKASRNQIISDTNDILNVTLCIAMFSIVLELFAISLIIRKIFYPIKLISKGLEDLSKGDFSRKIYVDSHDEISEACMNFNMLSDKLDTTFQTELEYQVKLRDLEYKALQMQINPHFLYNSLNSLKWMANVQKSESIKNMVDSLWTLLKIASHSDGHIVPLSRELELIDAFAYIQNVRYKHKFELIKSIGHGNLEFMVPQFILQPFVENSIFHGIAPKQGCGKVFINSYLATDDLCGDGKPQLILEVFDDGIGMTKEHMERILAGEKYDADSGVMNNLAIHNVRDRLSLLYGRTDLLHVRSEADQYTLVEIRIPQFKEHNSSLNTVLGANESK
ncbi:MAG: histidine kinase [Bacillota bacterium]